jgi:hypothetical protein
MVATPSAPLVPEPPDVVRIFGRRPERSFSTESVTKRPLLPGANWLALQLRNYAPTGASHGTHSTSKKTSSGCTSPREFRVILPCPTVLFGAQMTATPSRPADLL